ncbi:MAG TPA: RNA polymerase sigma factor [Terriglobales bacterium]|jgi:RNA polymerase sigma-70 factor (ECF subfamily)|nr:RNA polymerase sigma factor [Terriglobales bacterium]
MSPTALEISNSTEPLSDEEVVRRVLDGETALYELIMRRYNQRLYRVARGILRDEAEAEDVMQDAYVRAYEHLGQFAGRSQFATWLTRIAIHEALARAQRRKRIDQLGADTSREAGIDREVDVAASALNPEEQLSVSELGWALEEAILSIPERYRLVLMMRDVEQLSTTETAAALELSEENVKVRLHRARAMVRKSLFARAGSEAPRAFGFMGERCDRVVARVMAKICAAGK